MKNTITTLFILFNLVIYAQENDKTEWSSGEFYTVAQNPKTGETVLKMPEGKVESITYDKFFKSYDITYSNKDNAIGFLEFKYVKKLEDGTIIVQEETNGMFAVFDMIKENGKLLFVSTKNIDEENRLILAFEKIGK